MHGNGYRLLTLLREDVVRTMDTGELVTCTFQHCRDFRESFFASHGNSILRAIPKSIGSNGGPALAPRACPTTKIMLGQLNWGLDNCLK